jgi:hypothetical protein
MVHIKINLPNCRPQPSNVSHTRQADFRFNIPASEAESIPSLNHAALIFKIVGLLLRQGYNEGTIGCGDRCRIIPFDIVGCLYIGFIQPLKRWKSNEKYPIMEVDRLPIGVVARVECTAVSVEFVGENENQLTPIFVRRYTVCVDGRVLVN